MRFGLCTLGCKVNQYETQAMEQRLRELGHTVCDFSADCDGYIINTCTVTAVADKKNRAIIRRTRKAHPLAIIGVCGCYAQVRPDDIRALRVDVLSGSAGREEFVQMMVSALPGIRQERLDEALKRREFERLPPGGLTTRTRAMLKVQDGCSNFCSYCIIPYARGPVRSQPLDLAVADAVRLAREGYQEIVVTGIEVASWGRDLPGKPNCAALIAAICTAVPQIRIRLGSLEPRVVTEEFCRKLSGFSTLCPQFHLSMQSGSDTVLRRMNRRYDTARYLESVTLLKAHFPGCAVTTDMIVAFPGETEAEFAESLAFIRRCGFAAMHIFPYSRRPGTPADKMADQHPNAVKEARSAAAIAVAEALTEQYNRSLLGTTQQVLFEEADGPLYTGHAPNYVRVWVETTESLHNQIRPVLITGFHADGLRGELI